jgi:predicted lipoprotein with Yx(FWY)xxD motif
MNFGLTCPVVQDMKALRKRSLVLLPGIAALALTLASCGDDNGDGSSSTAGDSSATASSGTVSVQSVDGTDVLVDSEGRTLYSPDEEKSGKVLCSSDSCTAIWDPVTASEGKDAPSDVTADLGTISRPDGESQLSFDGAPLYRFTEEGPGELTGEGVADSFDGTTFTWHAATTGAPPSSSDSAGSSDSSGSGGGYGY